MIVETCRKIILKPNLLLISAHDADRLHVVATVGFFQIGGLIFGSEKIQVLRP